jgi:glycosyltransferase involved in cell wall biosynthesis
MEVSVVIPTRNRTEMLLAAVRSALSQAMPPAEVIVVIDGPETARTAPSCSPGCGTAAALRGLEDGRVRILELPEAVGGAEARNYGVRAATSAWIAFLDDDDLWLPEKLAVQMEIAALFREDADVVLSCRVIARSPTGEEIWPRRIYAPSQTMGEYLFCRQGLRYGDALLQTSTLVAPRRLLMREPFRKGLKKHQDWDWLIRVAEKGSARVISCGEAPLVVFHIEGNRWSVGRTPDWIFSLGWARAMAQDGYLSDRAMSGFVATECAPQLGAEGSWKKLVFFATMLRSGQVLRQDWVRLMVFLWMPMRLRRWMRQGFLAAQSGFRSRFADN